MFRLGNLSLPHPVVVAPMAGVSDAVFRGICREHGSALCYTEMVSARGLVYRSAASFRLLPRAGEGQPVGLQLFGSDPAIMARATRLAWQAASFQVLDINMGCPVKKVVRNGDGAALMLQPQLASRVVRAVADAVPVTVTAKFRAGWVSGGMPAPEFARLLVQSGARGLTIHGRTVEQGYRGPADWDIIRQVREAVDVPVLGNGGIFQPREAREMMAYTGVEGIMLARGVLGNPWLIARTRSLLQDRREGPLPTPEERISQALEHLERRVALYGEERGLVEMRKFAAWYVKGLPGAAGLRRQLTAAATVAGMKRALSRVLYPGQGKED